jgi:hypothetical protein
LDKQLLFKLVRAMPMEMVSDAVINNRRVPIDWQWREYETLRLYSTFLCYKNVCFEIMNWKYEFIEITLILTINDDILVTLNDITLTSTILVNLYSLWHAQSGKRHSHKNLFRLSWKKSRFLLYAGFYCVVWFHVTKQAMAACSDNIYMGWCHFLWHKIRQS